MNINTDINILGGLPDFNLVNIFLKKIKESDLPQTTRIKTVKSIKRFEKAINNTLIKFANQDIANLFSKILNSEGISQDSMLMLFWNASLNNELLDYLNIHVYFPALYSGRVMIKKDEIVACIMELKQSEPPLKSWSESTINTTASKYLTLLRKFNLMEGSAQKTIRHTYISDKLLILFLYWMLAIESKSNILESRWLEYCFLEKETFVRRVMEKRFMKFLNINYTGDRLTMNTMMNYEDIYDELN